MIGRRLQPSAAAALGLSVLAAWILGACKESSPPSPKPEPEGAAGSPPLVKAWAPPEPVPITKLQLDASKVEIHLPGPVNNAVVGAAGRFYVLQFEGLRKLGVVDLCEGGVIKYLPLETNDVLLTAGANELLVADRGRRVVDHYGFPDLERTRSQFLPVDEPLQGMVMGAASSGPLMLVTGTGEETEFRFVDPETMVDLKPRMSGDVERFRDFGNSGAEFRASANGALFCGWRWPIIPDGIYSIMIRENGEALLHYGHDDAFTLMPSTDGHWFSTGRDSRSAIGQIFGGQREKGPRRLSATHGDLTLWAPYPERYKRPVARLFVGLDEEPLATLKKVNMPTLDSKGPMGMGVDEQVVLVPDAGVIAALSEERDRLFLHALDLEKILELTPRDYVFVRSRPPWHFEPGETFSYPIEAVSSRGEIKFQLMDGPEGMQLRKGGLVEWEVPEDWENMVEDVTVKLTDASEGERLHRFRIRSPRESRERLVARAHGNRPIGGLFDLIAGRDKDSAETPLPEIAAPDLGEAGRTTVSLPGEVSDVAVGGAGRYLVLAFPAQKQLGVFDVGAGRVIGFIPTAGERFEFTAGREKLVLIDLPGGAISRWDLASLKREAESKLTLTRPLWFVEMGSATDGPLVIGIESSNPRGSPGLSFYDLDSLARTSVRVVGQSAYSGREFRVSADGSMCTSWTYDSRGGQIFAWDGRGYEGFHKDRYSPKSLLPAANGAAAFADGIAFDAKGEPLGEFDRQRKPTVPAAHGPFHLVVVDHGGGKPERRSKKDEGEDKPPRRAELGLYRQGADQMLARVGDLEPIFGDDPEGESEALPIDKRLHLIPAAKCLAALDPKRDKLHLYRIDSENWLEESGIDYLFVTSDSPPTVKPGKIYSYPIEVRSKHGAVSFDLEEGVEGMAVTSAGQVHWKVPEVLEADTEIPVAVRITDAIGQVLMHRFQIGVLPGAEGEPDAPGAVN